MNRIQVQVIITSIRSKGDRGLGFSAVTPELSVVDKVKFMELQNINLEAVFTPLDAPNAPEYKIDKEMNEKSPSTRLRNVLFVLHGQLEIDEDFDSWYRVKMEQIIEGIKNKLE